MNPTAVMTKETAMNPSKIRLRISVLSSAETPRLADDDVLVRVDGDLDLPALEAAGLDGCRNEDEPLGALVHDAREGPTGGQGRAGDKDTARRARGGVVGGPQIGREPAPKQQPLGDVEALRLVRGARVDAQREEVDRPRLKRGLELR